MIEALQRAIDVLGSLIVIGVQTLALLFIVTVIVGVLRLLTSPKRGGDPSGD